MLNAKGATTRVARDLTETIWSYVRLTKPRIVMLLVITTIPAMILAEGGLPSVWLMLATVLGGSVVAGGANAMNMYFDRDIDEMMLRTRERPVPAGQVEPEKAAVFGIVLGASGFAFMYLAVNPLAACLTLGAFAFYVIVYTLILKRTTPLNIVIGGAAGAMPPMIGWAAVTNELQPRGDPDVRHRHGVDAAALLGALHQLQQRLRARRRPDAARRRRPRRDEAPDTPVLHRACRRDQRSAERHGRMPGAFTWRRPRCSAPGSLLRGPPLALDGSAQSSTALFRYSIVYLALLFAAIALDGSRGSGGCRRAAHWWLQR